MQIFDFSKESLTQAKMTLLKSSLNDEFTRVFRLCEEVLSSAAAPHLVVVTLQTLQKFLTWIPLGR